MLALRTPAAVQPAFDLAAQARPRLLPAPRFARLVGDRTVLAE
jgi:hypothetical protein